MGIKLALIYVSESPANADNKYFCTQAGNDSICSDLTIYYGHRLCALFITKCTVLPFYLSV